MPTKTLAPNNSNRWIHCSIELDCLMATPTRRGPTTHQWRGAVALYAPRTRCPARLANQPTGGAPSTGTFQSESPTTSAVIIPLLLLLLLQLRGAVVCSSSPAWRHPPCLAGRANDHCRPPPRAHGHWRGARPPPPPTCTGTIEVEEQLVVRLILLGSCDVGVSVPVPASSLGSPRRHRYGRRWHAGRSGRGSR
jgi:hypothetical protein